MTFRRRTRLGHYRGETRKFGGFGVRLIVVPGGGERQHRALGKLAQKKFRPKEHSKLRRTFMKRITHVVLMFALAAVGSSSALGQKALAKGGKTMTSGPQATAVAEEILQLERMYDQAFIRPTAEEMERLHTDDFMMTARGKVTTRAELLARLNDPNHRRDVIESLTTDDVKVRIYGDTAVTTGRLVTAASPWPTTRRLPPRRSRSNQTA